MSRIEHCKLPWYGSEVIRLAADEDAKALGFAFQDLIIGPCVACKKVKLYWQGIKANGEYGEYFYKVKVNDEHLWYARKEATLAIPPENYHPKGVDCVWGSSQKPPYNKRLVPVY